MITRVQPRPAGQAMPLHIPLVGKVESARWLATAWDQRVFALSHQLCLESGQDEVLSTIMVGPLSKTPRTF